MEIYLEVFGEIDVFQYLLPAPLLSNLATIVWPKPCEQKRNPNLAVRLGQSELGASEIVMA